MLCEELVEPHSQPLCPSVLSAKKAQALGLLLCVGALAVGLGGCFFGGNERSNARQQGSPTQPATSQQPISVGIDTAQGLTTQPGDGVGIFVQYDGNGIWKVWTSCEIGRAHV